MACCCRDFTKTVNNAGVAKLDYTTGDVLWMHGFKAQYHSTDSTTGRYSCYSRYYGLRYDPVANHIWCVGSSNFQINKLIAFHKSGVTKFTVSDPGVNYGDTTNSVWQSHGRWRPFDLIGGGEIAILSSRWSSTGSGDHPKITIFDQDGVITSQSPDLYSTLGYMVNSRGYNTWQVGSNYVCDGFLRGQQKCLDFSGSTIWSPGTGIGGGSICAWDGSNLYNDQGCVVSPTTGIYGSPLVAGGSGLNSSSKYVMPAGAGCVWMIPQTGTITTFDVWDLVLSNQYNGIPYPDTPLAMCVFLDGSTVYISTIAKLSGVYERFVESWDGSSATMNWRKILTYPADMALLCDGIAVDDDSNVYVS